MPVKAGCKTYEGGHRHLDVKKHFGNWSGVIGWPISKVSYPARLLIDWPDLALRWIRTDGYVPSEKCCKERKFFSSKNISVEGIRKIRVSS